MDESYTNTVLQAISKALNEGVNDVTKVILTIVIIIILIIAFAMVFKFKNRKRIIKSSEASFQKLIRRFNLTILELDFVDTLTKTLKKPEEKYMLLVNNSKFRQAEHRAEGLSNNDKELSEQLKVKLGFLNPDSNTEEISTGSFIQGMPAKISSNSDELTDAEIYSVSESNLTVKFTEGIPVIPNEPINLITSTAGSLRFFKLQPDRVRGEMFSAPHTNIAETTKEKMKFEINVESGEPENNISHKSMVVLLSEQGVVITDRKNELQQGHQIRIFLSNDRKRKYPIEAEVVQTSEKKGLASVRFTSYEKNI